MEKKWRKGGEGGREWEESEENVGRELRGTREGGGPIGNIQAVMQTLGPSPSSQ